MNTELIFLILLLIWLFLVIVVKPYIKILHARKKQKIFNEIFGEDWKEKFIESLKDTNKENKLMKSGAVPTEADIELYYKMYLKKWELNHDDSYIWDTATPMKYEEFKKRAMEEKYNFLVSMTCDMFIGGFNQPQSMIRYRDYKQIVLEEKGKL